MARGLVHEHMMHIVIGGYGILSAILYKEEGEIYCMPREKHTSAFAQNTPVPR
jgi:hypothetical protein